MQYWAHLKESLSKLENSKALDRTACAALILFCGFLVLMPLILQLSRPFGLADYLGDHIGSSHPDRQLWKFKSVLTNFYFDCFQNGWNYRPATNLIYNLCYFLFKGDFWCFDLLKWTIKFLGAYLIYASLRNLGCAALPGLCGAVFFLFHPTCFESQTLAADPFVGFFFLVCFYLLTATPNGQLDVGPANLGRGKFCGLLAAFAFLLGSKEPGLALGLSLILTLLIFSSYELRTAYRLLTLGGVFLVNFYLLLRPARPKMTAEGQPFLTRLVEVVHFSFGLPPKSWYMFFLLAVILYGLYRAAKPAFQLVGQRFLVFRFRDGNFKFYFCLVSAFLAVTLFNSIPVAYPSFVSPRYAIPGAMILALLIGLSLAQVVRVPRLLCGLFLLIYPVLTGQNILDNHLILHKMHREASGMLCFLLNKQREGMDTFQLVPHSFPMHDIWPEDYDTVRNFFNEFGPVFYKTPMAPVKDLGKEPPASPRFALFTAYEYKDLDPALRKNREVVLHRFPRPSCGILEKLPALFSRAARVLGKEPYLIVDRNNPPSRLKVFVFRESARETYQEVSQLALSFGALAR